jgi:hypothetical protein
MNKKYFINKPKQLLKRKSLSTSYTNKTIINSYEINCNQYYIIYFILIMILLYSIINGKLKSREELVLLDIE